MSPDDEDRDLDHRLSLISKTEKFLFNKDLRVDQIKTYLLSHFDVTQEHADFLINLGGARKLRWLFHEVIKFDLQYGTRTLDFISEETLKNRAVNSPLAFANPASVKEGVKHRSSSTTILRHAFDKATQILRDNGIAPENVSFYDHGCGAGKPLIVARLFYTFKHVVGIDNYEGVLDIARKNMHNMGYDRKDDENRDLLVALEHADSGQFYDYRGPEADVIYMYNPFGRKIVEEVNKQIMQNSRRCVLVYTKPLHGKVFSEKDGWKLEHSHADGDPDLSTKIFSRGLAAPSNDYS